MNLWEIATNLENASMSLHQIRNLLQIYDEHIEDELKLVAKYNDSSSLASYFVDRFDLLRSLLETMQLRAKDTAEILQKQIDSIYDAAKPQHQSEA